ncbi:hypothetical protein ICN48_10575 [Polynucleobacter sp. JS-Safj-400b-B2]|uniref:hypothetical protein n=1 Tax=Polynucleobacter sp. JS-Safj-400b-B2 TaxID=2576921 RepID=UPI001C0B15C7|nr:hypothetical protein [Polynucleobacter sp. JS-Safj-400b-B2]MBU3626674.1 hypothetical protein [Polynucleobacter sp. JS-Safj-400b-B2]
MIPSIIVFYTLISMAVVGLIAAVFAYRYALSPMDYWKTKYMNWASICGILIMSFSILLCVFKNQDLKLMLSSNQAIALEIILVAMILPVLALAWQLGAILQINFWINLLFSYTYRPVIRLTNEVLKSGSATVVIGQTCCQAMKPIHEEAKS